MGNIFEKFECFGIDISIVNSKLDITSKKISIRRQDAGSIFNIADPIVINADPFLFVSNDRMFLFYEQTTYRNDVGRIMMVSTSDLKEWTQPIQITDEKDVHFSFPFVFEDNGEVYMLPETGWKGEIRLYKAKDKGLTNFELDTVLMKHQAWPEGVVFDFADNVIHKKDGIYYLFTSFLDAKGYVLQLFTANTLKGPYTLHPSSPICHNNKYGRNAGSLIEHEGRLFRPAQDCSQTYGGQVNVMEITKLTPEIYEEKLYIHHILPVSDSFHRQGGHQLNCVYFRGLIVMVTDTKRDRAFPIIRIADKIKKILGITQH